MIGIQCEVHILALLGQTTFDMMNDCNILILRQAFDVQNTSGSCNKVNAPKAPVQVFGTLFLIEMSYQHNRTIIHSSPGC